MAWHASGEERVKSYRVYKELEAERDALQRQNDYLRSELSRKDALIRSMAQELNAMAERLDIPAPIVPRTTVIEGGLTVSPVAGPTMVSERLLPSDKGLPHSNSETPSEPNVRAAGPKQKASPSGTRTIAPHPSTIVGRYSQVKKG